MVNEMLIRQYHVAQENVIGTDFCMSRVHCVASTNTVIDIEKLMIFIITLMSFNHIILLLRWISLNVTNLVPNAFAHIK